MNAAAARLKSDMKERFKHNSEQEVNPMSKPAVFTPNPGAAKNLVVLSRGRRRFEPSLPAEESRWQETLFILFYLCSTYTGVNLVF